MTEYDVEIVPEAEADLDNIFGYIAYELEAGKSAYKIVDDLYEAIAKLKDARLCFEDELCIEPDAILSAARSAYRECGLGLVIVDQLQDLDCGTLKNGPVGWGVVESRLHQQAALYEIPVLFLSGTTANEDIVAESVLRGYSCFANMSIR